MTELRLRGHERALRELRELRSHALLFVGPEGVGRRRAARWLAALLNCQASEPARPCGRCASCRLFETHHPDYREISPAVTTASGRVSRRPEIRIGQLVPRGGEDDPLSRWLEQRPMFSRRVGVIDSADRLTQAAANAFLKVLEEPPSYATVVLVAPSVASVLPTVASRCVVVRFGAVDTAGLQPEEHPAHSSGRVGPLLAAQADPEGYAAVEEASNEFLRALDGDLEGALEAADALEKVWSNQGPVEPVELLRHGLRTLPPGQWAAADALLAECEEAIAAYASPALAIRVLLLELRSLTGRGMVSEGG